MDDATAEGLPRRLPLAAQAHLEDEVRKTVGPVRQDEGINAA
jgi:hypothetical protein